MTDNRNFYREFFEDSDGRASASRLNMIIGVIIGGLINLLWPVLYKAPCGKDLAELCATSLPGEIFGGFMLATGGVYGFSKWRESVQSVEQIKADSPNQPVPDPAPPQPVPATVINVGSPKADKVGDANITAQGDVNVNSVKKKVKK